MKNLRVIDPAGNKQDYETPFVPRIGERIMLTYGIGREPVRDHFFRVKDVVYRLDQPADIQVAILLEHDNDQEHWPD